MTETENIAGQLADEWTAHDPAARALCISCNHHFAVAGMAGVPSMTCPLCNFTPNPMQCDGALAQLRRRWAEEADAPAPAPSKRSDPPRLDDVIGNPSAVLQIRTALDAHHARNDGSALPHMLLAGVGGVGKTMLAEIIAGEIGKPIRLQMGQSMTTPARVCDVLRSLKAGDVLFIDEIHGLKPAAQEALYRAMEDGVFVPPDKAGKPIGPPIKIRPFTLIGATTDEWGLLQSFLQRFKYRVRLERMTTAELTQAVSQRAARKGWTLSEEAAAAIAARSHGTPRLAVSLSDGCMDTAIAQGCSAIDIGIVAMTCEIWGIDGLGLDKAARRYLSILHDAGGGPVRLNVLATKLDGLSRRTVETRIEPDLVWLGLISKDADGRRLSAAGTTYCKGKKTCV